VTLTLTEFNWKGAAIQKGLEPGRREITIVEAVIRQLLVKTLWAGKELAFATVTRKM
jgi:hypothetical protein